MNIGKDSAVRSVAMTLAVPDKNGASHMFYLYAKAFLEAGIEVQIFHGSPPVRLADTYLTELERLGACIYHMRLLNFPIPFIAYKILSNRCQSVDAIIGFHQNPTAPAGVQQTVISKVLLGRRKD